MGARFLMAVVILGLNAGVGLAQDGYIGSIFGRGKKSPPRSEQPVANPDGHLQVPPEYLLTPKNGPFHIFVASYVGDRGSDYAVRLAADLRKLGFEAYVHNYREREPFYRPNAQELESMRKKWEGKTPRFPQLKTPLQDNWVVVVGNFAGIENDRAFDSTMNKLKRLNRESFSQPVAVELRWGNEANRKKADELVGLRGTANPLRPREEKVDLKMLKMLKEMNQDEPFSIYQLRAPCTLCVCNFTAGVGIAKEEKKGFFGGGTKQSLGMAKAADNARIVCKLLRDMGEEAYVFHSDTASVVCVNGYAGREDPKWVKDFDKYAKMKLANGMIELKPSLMPTPKDPTPYLMNAN